MKHKWLLILGVSLVPPCLVWAGRATINKTYPDWEGVIASISLILAIYVAILQWFFNHSDHFFLTVQRLKLRFLRTHTHWCLTAKFELSCDLFKDGISNIPELFKQIQRSLESVEDRDISIANTDTTLNVVFGSEDTISFSINSNETERPYIYLKTNKMLVPSHIYNEKLHNLGRWLESIGNLDYTLDPSYELQIEFKQNPFFGFYLKRLPRELIENFNCSINLPTTKSTSEVTTTKDYILVRSTIVSSLLQSANDCLTLTGPIARGA